MDKQPVIVTTEWRGVFFGYLIENQAPDKVVLSEARMCIWWSKSCKGVFGLAAMGPDSECRIGPAVSKQTLYKITSIVEVSDEAVQKWEAGPWR